MRVTHGMLRSGLLVGAVLLLRHNPPKAQEAEPEPARKQAVVDCQEASKGGPADVVRALYEHYPWPGPTDIASEPREVLARYFDRALTKLLIDEQECVARERALCRVTVSIQYDAQDGSASDLRVCEFDKKKSTVDVRFKNFGVEKVVRYKLRSIAAGWRISDVGYADGSSLVKELSRRFP